ncbi:MAG: PepSY domain-containing protein [Proteobacteria bacterium]|nr:PepSY domain-containing protein [Pseudomonadota bacterium]
MTRAADSGDAVRASSLYRAVWRWHFVAGLLVLPVLVLLAVTGGLYLFKPELSIICSIARSWTCRRVPRRGYRPPPWSRTSNAGSAARCCSSRCPSGRTNRCACSCASTADKRCPRSPIRTMAACSVPFTTVASCRWCASFTACSSSASGRVPSWRSPRVGQSCWSAPAYFCGGRAGVAAESSACAAGPRSACSGGTCMPSPARSRRS